jgi:ABC-type uncharacterized transport system substrate-binding protein
MNVQMRFVLKRLSLGFFLIILVSLALLISDWNHRKHSPGKQRLTNTPGETSNGLATTRAPHKVWNIHLLQFTASPPMDETHSGILKGLKESGLEDGRDFRITARTAQGDIATLDSMVDAAVNDGADMIMTMSTPALQAAFHRVKDRPIVYSIAVDPKSWGAGKTNEDHPPNVTGVYVTLPVNQMIQAIQECAPKARRIGTLFVPSETNSVFVKDTLVAEARKAGLEVVTAPVSGTSEVLDAAISLTTRNIDIFCQIADNTSSSSFPSIIEAADKARLPLFCFSSKQAEQGAVLSIANDYHDNGIEAGHVAARVMRGENPASIPYTGTQKVTMVINLMSAKAIGFSFPESMLKEADEIIRKPSDVNSSTIK